MTTSIRITFAITAPLGLTLVLLAEPLLRHVPAAAASAGRRWAVAGRGISGPIAAGLAGALIGITYLGTFAATRLSRDERSRLLRSLGGRQPVEGRP